MSKPENNIILSQDENGVTNVSVRFSDEDVWLTQNQIAEIYDTTQPNISMHIDGILKDGELAAQATHKKFLLVQTEGKRQAKRNMAYRVIVLAAMLPMAAAAGIGERVPRERILPDLVRRADSTYRKVTKQPERSYGCRELFVAMLAYAEAGTNVTRVAELLALAEGMQNREPGHPREGNFRWYSHQDEVLDQNAVDFCMQHGALLWRLHRDALDATTRERLRDLLERGLCGLRRHRPRVTYTNIALLNASDLILLGEALGDASAVAEGERRLRLFLKTLWEEGTHEYVSPTYYGVNLETMLLLEAFTESAAAREMARTVAAFAWTDVALNWYAPAQRLGGAQSRTYDYLFGGGEADQILTAYGWLPCGPKFAFSTFGPLYARAPLPADVARLNVRYPRLVEQMWGGDVSRRRTHYVCKDVTLGTATWGYGERARMDIALAVDLPGGRGEKVPRLSFIPDGRGDPYGKTRILDGSGHSKAMHLSPWWSAAQDRADALGMALYRERDLTTAEGRLESHLIFRRRLDSIWVGHKQVVFENGRNTVYDIPVGAAVFLRQGSAAVGLRMPWGRGMDGSDAALRLVDDGNAFGALRLTAEHAWVGTNGNTRMVAGVAFWVRVGSGLDDDAAFTAFREAFMAAEAKAGVTAEHVRVDVAGQGCPLWIEARVPFDTPGRASPMPAAMALGVDGVDVGREILQRSPVIQAYLKTRQEHPPVAVASRGATIWEAETCGLTVPFEKGYDEAASEGAFLWVPEVDGVQEGGSGRARYRLAVAEAGKYTLAGRVLTPTPEDDSFFMSVQLPDGSVVEPEFVWAPGVHKNWTWRPVQRAGTRGTWTLELQPGEVWLDLRSREAGSKIDQLRIERAE